MRINSRTSRNHRRIPHRIIVNRYRHCVASASQRHRRHRNHVIDPTLSRSSNRPIASGENRNQLAKRARDEAQLVSLLLFRANRPKAVPLSLLSKLSSRQSGARRHDIIGIFANAFIYSTICQREGERLPMLVLSSRQIVGIIIDESSSRTGSNRNHPEASRRISSAVIETSGEVIGIRYFCRELEN